MIRVLHIVLGLKTGGLERVVLDLVHRYRENVDSTIVCLETAGNAELIEDINIIELNKPPGLHLPYAKKLMQIIKKEKIDIVHTHNPSPHFYGALAGFLAGIPVVHTKHGRNYPDQYKKIILNRVSSFFTDKIIAVSNDSADVCREIEKIPAHKITTILNGVDTEKFVPAPAGRRGAKILFDDADVVIGIVARLSKEKDHETLFKACRILKDRQVGFRLVVVGDGPLRFDLEKQVYESGISDCVTFLGDRQDIPELMQAFDLFVLSSITEGISLTLLEAMSSGLPVVATFVGGTPEVVSNEVTGLLVAAKSPEKLAEKLRLLIESPLLRRQMGEKGRQWVVERFALDRVANEYVSIYKDVLQSRERK